MHTVVRDLYRSLRALRATPVLTSTLVLVLGLGIGANCALFAVINSYLLRPLTYESPERLVEILQPPRSFVLEELKNARSLAGAAAFEPRGFRIPGADSVRNLYGNRVSPGLFTLLGVKPALGRAFMPGEETQPVVILGYDYWRRISGDPKIIGQVLTIDDERRTVIGVLPADFTLQVRDANIFVPWRMTEGRTIARLSAGATLAQADAEVRAIIAASTSRAAQQPRGSRTGVEPLASAFRPGDGRTLWLLQVAAGLVLLIACANIGNILLVRANLRRREFAIRAAIGAGRGQILRQLTTEHAILTLAGGILGTLLAIWSSSFLHARLPGNITRRLQGADALGFDHRVLFFALAVSSVTVLVFGLAPAAAAMRLDVVSALRSTGYGEDRERRRSAQLFVIAEIALAVTLLIGAGVTLKSLLGLQNRYLGFSPDHVLRTAVDLPESRHPLREQRLQTLATTLQRLQAIPGVTAVGLVGPQLFPFGGPRIRGREFTIRGRPEIEARAEVYTASIDYFRSVQIPLLKGRSFTAADTSTSTPVALISEGVARRYWTDDDPIGAVIHLSSGDPASPWVTIVGVVGDVRNPVGLDVQPTAYRPLAQTAATGGTIMIRTAGDPGLLAQPVRRELRTLLPGTVIFEPGSLEKAVRDYVSPQRFTTSLLGIFAVLGLLLAAAGVYGVMQHWVARRIPEIGLRIALGADANAVVGLVFARCAKTVAWGLGAGALGALALQKLISSQLYDVSPADPLVLFAVMLLMAFTGLAAAAGPALWAARIEPVVALKYE